MSFWNGPKSLLVCFGAFFLCSLCYFDFLNAFARLGSEKYKIENCCFGDGLHCLISSVALSVSFPLYLSISVLPCLLGAAVKPSPVMDFVGTVLCVKWSWPFRYPDVLFSSGKHIAQLLSLSFFGSWPCMSSIWIFLWAVINTELFLKKLNILE